MTERVVDRRMLLRGAGVAGATVLGGTAFAASAQAKGDRNYHGGHGVSGAWLITHKDDPPNPPETARAVAAFADGGVFITQDIAPVAPGSVGAWSSEHDNGFSFNFWTGFPAGHGSPAATANIKGRGEVHHDTISGTYTFTIYSARNMKKVLHHGTGKLRGHRIET